MAPKKKGSEAAAPPADDVSMGEAAAEEENPSSTDQNGPIDPNEQRIRIVSFLYLTLASTRVTKH
jgi:hypothetical protein